MEMLELPTGLEPVTYRLQGGCSTVELWERVPAGGRRCYPQGEKEWEVLCLVYHFSPIMSSSFTKS